MCVGHLSRREVIEDSKHYIGMTYDLLDGTTVLRLEVFSI